MLLTDGDRIRSLLATYCHLIDAGDFSGVGVLMKDAVLMAADGTTLATGADEVAALYAGIVRVHDDGTPMTQHVVVNSAFDEPADDGSVRVTSNYLVFQATPDLPLQPIITGRYVDTFDQDQSGRWRFSGRRFGLGRSGTLDHHLTISPGAHA